MTDTSHDRFAVDARRMATTYEKAEGGWRADSPQHYPFPSATGSIVSRAWDFVKFCQLFLNGGEFGQHRFMDAAIVRQATSLQAEAE